MTTTDGRHGTGGPRQRAPRPAGVPSRFGTTGDFRVRTGARIDPATPRGYYIDFSDKADAPAWPPPWLATRAHRMHVVPIQWALGCWERFLETQDESWLAGARAAADWLVGEQQQGGRQDGGWVKDFPYKHTYRVDPPWLSGMAQGQGASLLVRVYAETGDERYAEAARRALRPMRVPIALGGVAASLGGGRFPQEYPTDPPSHVLNGGIFGLWGSLDVALGLGDADARDLTDEGLATLSREVHRFDTGSWSRYDLFPHPVVNVAHSTYHRLHVAQLEATAMFHPDPPLRAQLERFRSYDASRAMHGLAFARKVLFRIAVPRSPRLARLLPWAAGPGS